MSFSLLRNIPRCAAARQIGIRLSSTESSSPSLDSILRDALKRSMKQKQKHQVDTIKSVLGDMQQLQHTASPPPPAKILQRAIDRRLSAAADFLKATPPRSDLADQFNEEATFLQTLAPAEPAGMTAEELDEVVKSVLSELGFEDASGKRTGQVMKAVMAKLEGRAGGKDVSEAVKRFNSAK